MNILVIGETCIDEYVYGVSERICPEAPVPCFKTNGKKNNTLGMASNVKANIEAISNYNVDIITNDVYPVKRRFVDSRYNHIVFREDENDVCCRSDLRTLNVDDYDAVVISDYDKGFLSNDDIAQIIKISNNERLIFLDTKKKIGNFIDGVSFLKINSNELRQNITDLTSVISYCEEGVIITHGGDGCTYHKHPNTHKSYEANKVEVTDVCGAGDTFLSAFVVRILQTDEVGESIAYANDCASKVVKKSGVCTP